MVHFFDETNRLTSFYDTVIHFDSLGFSHLPELTVTDFKNKIQLDTGLYGWIHFEGRRSAENIAAMLRIIDAHNANANPDKRITTSVELEKRRENLGQ